MPGLLLWGLMLLLLALLLVILELFLPSAGVIAATAAATALAGVVCLFVYDAAWGFAGLLMVLVAGPLLAWGLLNVWQNTPMGRKMIGAPTEEELLAKAQAEQRERESLAALIGMEGEAVTAMRPVGVVRIGGKRMDAVAEFDYIEAGDRVEVTYADGLQTRVRRVEPKDGR